MFMLIITQGRLNVLVTTLTEKKVNATKIYLIELVQSQENKKFYCVNTDVSISPNRYNQFCVYENSGISGTTNPLNGQILLPLAGFYYYNVYENPLSVLSPTGLHQVETGKCLVIANKVLINPTYVSNANQQEIVFNPENYL